MKSKFRQNENKDYNLSFVFINALDVTIRYFILYNRLYI